MHWARRSLFFALVAIIAAVHLNPGTVRAASRNFSQYPGFDAWYAANPPSDSLPNADEQALLRKHQPRFFLGANQTAPLDFYADYIAHGTLRDAEGKVISANVTAEVLNKYKDNPDVIFTHEPPSAAAGKPRVFGRLTREEVTWLGKPQSLTFLTYNLAFAHSGLTSGLLGWQKLGLGLVGDLKDWHQLDHYTAATVILGPELRPFALMLQQHNYMRTHLFGETVNLPEDGRPLVDIAVGSNELFAHREGRTSHRAVPFLRPDSFRYMIGSGSRPVLTADDVTEPEHDFDYDLTFVAPSDAFYTFKGFLGELRLLPGRDGPPGADYNTLPEMKPMHLQMLGGYWRYGNEGDIARLEVAFVEDKYWIAFARGQSEVFFANAACAKAWGAECAFE